MYQYIFKRCEKKYILDMKQYAEVLKILSLNATQDKYGESEVCNIYCDTDDYRIIRASIQKPPYKEKLRLRCYGIPNDNRHCFLELKKKYKGTVYKRRISLDYKRGLLYISGKNPEIESSQIKNEIDYFRRFYNNPEPKVNIFYKRKAFLDSSNENVRFTFDTQLRYRNYDLDLKNGTHGRLILPTDRIIMEIKTDGAMPLWVSGMLDNLKIFPTSFSKYGTAFYDMINQNTISIPNGGYFNVG